MYDRIKVNQEALSASRLRLSHDHASNLQPHDHAMIISDDQSISAQASSYRNFIKYPLLTYLQRYECINAYIISS